MSKSSSSPSPLAIILFGLTAVWILLALTTWRDLASGPRVGSPWTTYGYGQALLFGAHTQAIPTIAALVWSLAAALVGYYYVVAPLFGRRQLAAPSWQVIAGFIPGTLMLGAASRVLTLFLPNPVAAPLLLGSASALALYCAVKIANSDEVRPLPNRPFRAAPALHVVGALIVALVISVHVDRAHVAAEGSVWFITELFLSKQYGIGTSGYWPLISQHYDEAAFLYPLVYGLVDRQENASATLTAIYWITLAFGRLGMATITYLAVRALGLDRLSSLALLAFVCGAALSINPIASRVLFDSLSPLAYGLHISRILVPLLPLLLIAAVTALKPSPSWQSMSIAAVLGVGLSSITVHVAIIFPWALGVLCLTLLAPRAAESYEAWRLAAGAAIAIMLAFMGAYGLQALPDVLQAGLLLAGSLVAIGLLLGIAWFHREQGRVLPGFSAACLLISIGAGYALGLLLLGNVLIAKTLPVLASTWPWSNTVMVERFYSTLAAPIFSVVQSPYCEGYSWGFRTITGHCAGIAMFARTYGLGLVIPTCVLAWRLYRWPRPVMGTGTLLTPWFWGIMLALSAMPIGFILFDFVSPIGSAVEGDNQLSIWLRSRLIEPWFYSGSMLALALILRAGAQMDIRVVQSAMMIATALYALTPLALPSQIIANFSFLFAALLGL